jgi:hypothetical protein
MRRPALVPRLPVEQVAGALVLPAAVLRHGAVALATSSRQWELALTRLAAGAGDREERPEPTTAERNVEPPAEPPVDGWAEMAPQAASAALADLGVDDLDGLLAYEQAHGHRTAYLVMLRQRRDELASPA